MAGAEIEQGRGIEHVDLTRVSPVWFPREEQPVVLPRFSNYQKAALLEIGQSLVSAVGGKSLATLKEQFSDKIGYINPDVVSSPVFNLAPGEVEVALDPKTPFILDSAGHDFGSQLELVGQRDEEIRSKIPGVAVGLAQLPVATELLMMLKELGLKGEELAYCVRTPTPTDGLYLTDVGFTGSNPDRLLSVHILDKRFGHPRLVVIPVVVPIRETGWMV